MRALVQDWDNEQRPLCVALDTSNKINNKTTSSGQKSISRARLHPDDGASAGQLIESVTSPWWPDWLTQRLALELAFMRLTDVSDSCRLLLLLFSSLLARSSFGAKKRLPPDKATDL